MRLTCPRCGAQYEIDAAAIPAAGRDVECSACGHVWHAPGDDAAASAAPFDPDARPPLSRPLHESILSVLREEAARELQARSADANGAPQPDPTDPPARPGTPDWPATTVTHPAPRMSADILAQRMERDFAEVERDSARTAVPQRDAPPPVVPEGDTAPEPPPAHVIAADDAAISGPAKPLGAQAARPLSPSAPPALTVTAPEVPPESAPSSAARRAVRPLPTTPPRPVPPPAQAPAKRRSGYNAGFTLALMAALVLLAAYALAPRLADQGQLGVTLMEWRAHADQGRDWLQTRAEGLIDELRP